MKLLKKIIIIAAIAAAAITTIVIVTQTKSDNKIDANERMMRQSDYVETLQEFIKSTDTVTAGYISGEYDREAYLSRLSLLKDEFAIIEGTFIQWIKDNPIDLSTQSFISTEGESGIINANKHINELLSCTLKEDGTPYEIQELAYKYLQKKKQIQDDLITYIAANKWIDELDTYETDYENLLKELVGDDEKQETN